MKWPFKEGTKVRMTEYGFERFKEGDSNPRGLTGVVISPGRWCVVEWTNGRFNSYVEGTISPVQAKLENK